MFPQQLIGEKKKKKKISFYAIAVAFKQTDCSLHKVKDWVSEAIFSLLFMLDCLSIIGVIDTDVNERWNKVTLRLREQHDHHSNLEMITIAILPKT